MAYTPIDYEKAPFLGPLPLEKNGYSEYDLSRYVPTDTKEVLVYFYVTVREATRSYDKRAVYQIYTEDSEGNKYSQYMNVVFPTTKDFVMNSANLWLPVFDKLELKVKIPDSWSAEEEVEERSRPFRRPYSNLQEAMQDFVNGKETIFTGVILSGYRVSKPEK